ncbi:GntP family permease [Sporosarcina sp. FSL K6-3457]|uniref:GntP family permease n=1 Tax=Sporosarcina sp. FSL K6-3457 TaxID=2978204 RepID=UPI0030F4F68A
MGTTQFIVVLAISIAFLILMILKWKIHPVMALFITATGMGIGFGYPILKTIGLINSGFGGTMTSVALTIILGTVLAMGIQDIEASDSISQSFNRLFRGKRMELAPALTAFVVSIPVFGDVTMILLAPIASKIAHLKKISMATMASFTGLALFLTHGLVPPTPGILAISLSMEADLGFVIFWGIIVSFIAFFVTWFLLRNWTEKERISPLAKFLGSSDEETEAQLTQKGKRSLPPFYFAILPIMLPVVFIASASFANVYMAEGTIMHGLLTVIGDKTVALFLGVLIAIALAFLYKQNVYKSAIENDHETTNETPFTQILWNKWVERGLVVAILPLLITGMSGALGSIIKENPAVHEVATSIAETNILPILIPYLIAAVLMTAVGSMTMAALTAAAIVTPMMPILGLSPELAVLAIGAGSLTLNHLNNSGFWIMSQFYNLSTKQGLKYVTIPTFVGSVVALLTLLLFGSLGVL